VRRRCSGRSAIAFGIAVLGASGTAAQAEPYLNFACADGAKISVIFETSGTALVMIDGGALRLADQHPSSGLWYASPAGEFRANGEAATFHMIGRPPTTCRKAG
jgi:hypothetical protein